MLTKGHKLSKGGKRKGAGRKKTIANVVSEAIDAVREDLPDIFQKLKERALNGDREAQIYLIDRILGKPKQPTDLDIKGGKDLGSGLVSQVFETLAQSRQQFLTETQHIEIEEGKTQDIGGNNGQREAEGSDTGEGKALQG